MLALQGNCHAKYIMHPEVRNVTMALRHATQIGVLCYDTPELQGLPDKDAILVMSFGTTVTDARRTTIEKTVEELSQLDIECEPIREDEFTNKKMTFFFDPDGLPLELHE
jgi:hypothetical protein